MAAIKRVSDFPSREDYLDYLDNLEYAQNTRDSGLMPLSSPAPAPAAAFNPAGFDWYKGTQNAGGFTYVPQYGNWGGTPDDYSPGIGEVHRYKEGQMGPGQTYDVLDANTGQVVATRVVPKSSSGGFFGDFFDLAGTLAKEVAPLATTAVSMGGAAPLIGGLSAALGGGAAGTIAANALVQGGLGALQGGDFLESALRSAVTGGIGQAVNPIASSIGADVLNATDSKFLSDIVSGAVKGVPGALMSGDASNLLTGAVTGAVGSQIADELDLSPKQVQTGIGIASKLLQGGDLSPADLMRIGTSFGGTKPTASEITGGYGGAETSGMFDPDVEAGLLYYGSDPDQEKYIDEDRLLARYPAPTVEDVRTTMSPMELNKFLEANIEDPGTIETLMQEYFPELYRQQIEVVGNRPATELFPEFDQPLLTAETTTPAPSPAPAPAPTSATTPGQSPAPSPAPSAAPKAQSGMDMSGLFALLGMMNQGREKPDPYQVAQINARSPFGTVYDQQQDLLGLMERG